MEESTMSYSLGFTGEQVNNYLMMCHLLAKNKEKKEGDKDFFYTQTVTNAQGNPEKQYVLNRYLSEKNFSKNDKTKLDGIEEEANNYVLPTASTTEKGGIILGEGLEIDGDIVKVTRPTVLRSRLENKALFAPVKQITSSSYELLKSDIGYMLCDGTKIDITIYLTPANSKDIDAGAEISITGIFGGNISINFNGVKVGMAGDAGYLANGEPKTVSLLERFGIITLKKMMNDGVHDIWLISGSIRK